MTKIKLTMLTLVLFTSFNMFSQALRNTSTAARTVSDFDKEPRFLFLGGLASAWGRLLAQTPRGLNELRRKSGKELLRRG